MPRVGYLETGKILDVDLDDRREPSKSRGPLGRRKSRPGTLRRCCPGDGVIHLLEAAVLDGLQHRLSGRVDERDAGHRPALAVP